MNKKLLLNILLLTGDMYRYNIVSQAATTCFYITNKICSANKHTKMDEQWGDKASPNNIKRPFVGMK